MRTLILRTLSLGAASGAIALLMAGCAESSLGTCSTSADCVSGLACQPSGTCGIVPCSDGCLEGEVCLQLDSEGNYDPDAVGVCTGEECGSGRGAETCPEGEICLDGACYPDDGSQACTCNTDCAAGQGCVRGECSTPAAVCTGDCECAVGSTCADGLCTPSALCEGVVCEGGETCNPATGVCEGAAACDPACAEGETCEEGVCVGGGGGGLCDSCTTDAECGGPNDACVPLGAGTFCAQSCAGGAACPSGYTCLRVDSVVGEQCVPQGGACGGCLVDGCDAGEFCNSASQACEPTVDTCGACTSPDACGAGAVCSQIGGTSFCLTACPGGGACPGGYTCQDIRGDMLCAPASGSCGGGECDPACSGDQVCNGGLCVDCLNDGDCDAGQVCTPGGECVTSGAPCESISDCDVGFICDTRVNTCVECITPGDCATGEVCVAGVCQGCECEVGFRCNTAGECVESGDPGACSGDSECGDIAVELGGTGEGATCDSEIGCYTIGSCNGSFGGGGLPLPIPGDFGGTTDVFGAPCPAGTTCDFIISTDLFGGGGNLISFACKGCDPSDPDSCREGETCTTPLLPFPDETPYCSSGGGGLPFPIPFP